MCPASHFPLRTAILIQVTGRHIFQFAWKNVSAIRKSQVQGIRKNTKICISLGHTITEFSHPLTSLPIWNTVRKNINSEEQQKYSTDKTTTSYFNTTAGDGYFCQLLQAARSNYPTKSKSYKSVSIRSWTFLILNLPLDRSWTSPGHMWNSWICLETSQFIFLRSALILSFHFIDGVPALPLKNFPQKKLSVVNVSNFKYIHSFIHYVFCQSIQGQPTYRI